MSVSALWIVSLGVLGVVFGSFIATVAVRWPEGRSARRGRSACDGCGRTLTAAELVPILSYLWFRGRCRTCGAPIAAVHPVCEVLGGVIGIAAASAAPGWAGVAAALFGWLLLTLAAIDQRAFWLPDPLVLALAMAALVPWAAGIPPDIATRLTGGAVGFGALWLVAAAYRRVRGRIGLGGGDPKLMGAIGLWLGWRALPVVLLIASSAGIALVLIRLMRGRAVRGDDRLAFGTLLALAAFVTWLYLAHNAL